MAFQYDAVKSQRVDLQQSNTLKVGAGEGDDVYVIDAQNFPVGNKTIVIEDLKADGNNKLVLVGGLEIVSSKVFANALELTLSNNIVVQVLGASTFLFQTGGAVFTGAGGLTQSYADFVTQSLGTTLPAAGSTTPSTGSAVTVNTNGGGTSVTPPAATYALTGAASADEGSTATFALSTTNVAAGTQVAYTLSGIEAADLASGSLTGMATVGADGKAAITVALAADATTEGAENLVVTLDGKNISATTAVNDTSTTPVAVFSLTASAATANEGDAVTFTVAGGVANTTYNYDLSGVVATDVVGGLLTGTVTTDANGVGTFTVNLAKDRTSDGVDTLKASLPNTGLSASVTVNDTSVDNAAPVAVDATNTAVEGGVAVTGNLTATDADQDPLEFTLDAAVEGLTLNKDGSYSFDPTQNTVVKGLTATGTANIVANYTVTDGLLTDKGTLTIAATGEPVKFTLAAAATNDNLEGKAQTYTVTASEAVAADTAVQFSIAAGDVAAAKQGTSTTNMDDFVQGSFSPLTVTIKAGETTATYTVTGDNDGLTELPESYTVKATVAGQALTPLAVNLLDGSGTYNLKTDAEQISGTVNDDTFNGSNTTALLDVLDGKGGTDTLNYSDADGKGNGDLTDMGLTLTSMEVINYRSVAAAVADASGFTGVNNLNILKGTSATATAATTTSVKVENITGAITVHGGKDITVTDTATAGADITVGDTTVNAGTITVTDSKVGAGTIKVDGGTNVTVNATGSSGGADTIEVGTGGAATDLPTGTVNVTSAHTGVAATDVTLNAVKVTGGSTVTVTQTADTSKVADDTTGATLTQGAVTVVGGNTTTSVTVAQAATQTAVAYKAAVAGINESASVKFTALTAGQTVILGGLTLTASDAMTAAEVASAFANLTKGFVPTVSTSAGDTQGSAAAAKGVFTGYLNGWTTGAVSTDTVVFTSTTAGNVGDLANTGTGTATVTTTASTAAVTAQTGRLGVANGTVLIDDNATASITTVTVDGYAENSKIGNTGTLSKLANLTLANSGHTTAGTKTGDMTVDATGVSSLNLSVNNINGAVSLDGAADNALKTLNLTVTGADSSFALTAAAVETLAISGDKKATLSAGTFTALKTLSVTGSASAVFDGDEADTLTSVTTTGTTGAVTATIDGTKATYTGGAGVDTVTLATGAALTKAIDLGAGDDTLSFAALNVTGSTATLSGGEGNDTLSMAAATAATLDGSKQTFYTGFEYLTINDAGGSQTLDLANLGFTNRVTLANGGTITLDKLANNGTVVLNAATTATTVQITDAADATKGTADVLNVLLSSAGNLAGGTLTAADVETINITATDTDTTNGLNTDSLTLVATKATKINVSGNANLTLTNDGNVKVTEIDGSTMTGALTVQAAGGVASKITGGKGDDVLTASGGATGATAQVSTLTFTNGAAAAAMAAGDSISVTVGSDTVSQTFSTDFNTTLAALQAKIHALAGYNCNTAYNDDGVIKITAAVAGTPFTADATFTTANAASTVTAGANVEGAVNEVFDVATITFTEVAAMDNASDVIKFTVTDAKGTVTNVSQGWNTNLATTLGDALGDLGAYTVSVVGGNAISVTGKAGQGNITIGGFEFTEGGGGASNVTAVIADAAPDFVADADSIVITETTPMTAGDTIAIKVTNGVSNYTTAAVAFNTDLDTTMAAVATAVAGLNGGASFTAAYTDGSNTLTVTDKVTGGSPITNIEMTFVDIGATTVTDVFATTTANVTPIGDTLIGGDGADTLTSGAALGTMTGGAGQDLFVVGAASSNVNAYTTITDFTSSDLIKFAGAVAFKSVKVTLGGTAQFTDMANEAINKLALNEVGWFQHGTDTYLVMDKTDVSSGTTFENGSDFIVKLTGLIDLTNASFNNDYDTIAL